MVCRNLSAFADAPRAGSAEAKTVDLARLLFLLDAPRAGSAEAKFCSSSVMPKSRLMHPVQAAPRQRSEGPEPATAQPDAPRAGSAEAKRWYSHDDDAGRSDAPRAGSAEAKCILSVRRLEI